ncbi:MAG: zinc-binding dehydrogenase [Candidatus Krumholzibacteriota bacterium]
MLQVWMNSKGEVGVMEVREVARPDPAAGQVRIRVEAAGVNFADVMMRRGLYPDAPALPAVAGYEVAGTIDAVGDGVPEDLAGAPVVAMCNFGGYSEFVCLPRELVWQRPAAVTPEIAAAVPVNYLTAWQMVRVMAPVTEGDLVLIHSAAGGVGQAVIQLCRLAGARVIGSASPGKHEYLKEQGLIHVFDSSRRDFAEEIRDVTDGRGVDVALEPRHGRWIMESYRSLAKCGRLVLFGFSSAAVGKRSGTLSALRTLARVPWFQLNPVTLMNDNKSIAGVNLGRMWDQQARTSHWMTRLLEMLGDGRIAPVIDTVVPFDQAGRAHRRLEDRMNVGKVILVPRKAESA